ncbi:MAG: cytidine deaminase [Chloroflexia bacterium]|nr:cytidine deaminase [Chloroflexia bacterium]
MDTDEFTPLIQAALEARRQAYAPYSGFAVGAALQTASGEIFVGCNVENASYGLSLCAERVALGCAIAAGQRDFVALAVIADTAVPTPPCGMCRQVMLEFNPNLRVVMANLRGQVRVTTAQELLPGAFTAGDLPAA